MVLAKAYNNFYIELKHLIFLIDNFKEKNLIKIVYPKIVI